ncbi:hypothetical protein Tsubulata_026269 [Turnera subulata]|uniref:Uncharacterized protein n=1 Tax=Turnera subulata TaxID=218843 RepID=A0A9Q0FEV6_9ROSI|nr:hypothetical protein Tsubulata_026269 [Turnera subulata]
MAFLQNKNYLITLLFISSIFLASLHLGASRPLRQWVNQNGLALQSLQGSSSNPCSYIPGQSKGTCRLNGMNIAGSVVRAPAVSFSTNGMEVSVASVASETSNQDQRS